MIIIDISVYPTTNVRQLKASYQFLWDRNFCQLYINENISLSVLQNNLTISKVVKQKFRFCGLDLYQKDGETVLSMEDYAKSMFIAPIPAKTNKNASLTAKQLTMLREINESLKFECVLSEIHLSFLTALSLFKLVN